MEPKPIKETIQQSLTQVKTLETYDHIVLTEEETTEALRLARKAKATKLHTQQYWNKVNSDPVYPTYSAEAFQTMILERANLQKPGFLNDQWTSPILWALSLYFTGDKRFEALGEGYSLEKGVALFGGIGCGKTMLMELFEENQKESFIVKPTQEIAEEYQDEGTIAKYFHLQKSTIRSNVFGQKEWGLCFDDLGTEDIKKNYGNQLNAMSTILMRRYDARLFSATHLTFNLTADELEQMYGTRVRSRMREMFNVVAFHKDAPDRRG